MSYSISNWDSENSVASVYIDDIAQTIAVDIPMGAGPDGSRITEYYKNIDAAVMNQLIESLQAVPPVVDAEETFSVVSSNLEMMTAIIQVSGCALQTDFSLPTGADPEGDEVAVSLFNAACNANADLVLINMDPNSATYDPLLLGL